MRLIDADALEVFVKTVRQGIYLDKTVSDIPIRDSMLLNFQQYVHLQPTIDAVPVVHGRWIYPSYAPYGGSYVTKCCSRCNWEIPYSEERGSFNRSPFCPNCGAKMDEKEIK